MIDTARIGDVGAILEVTLTNKGTVVDLTGNSVLEIILKKPDGTKLTKTGVLSGLPTAGVIKYTTVAGDLNQSGEWKIEAHVTIPSGDFRSEIGSFIVEPPL